LAQVIMSGHKNRFPKMTQAEKDLIMAWIDSNGLYHGTYNYTQHGHTSDAIGKTYARLTAKMGQAGCFTCHEKRFTRDWINLQRPELSRVLRAPLAKGTNGYGQAICRNHKMDPKRYRVSLLPRGRYTHEVRPLDHYPKVRVPPLQPEGIPQATFADTSDPHYQAMLAIIREGREQALAAPRVDMPGAEVVAGKDRMLVLPPVPAVAPSLSVRHADAGAVSVTWRRTADNIGLPAELHRGASADFVPSAETLIQETLLDHAVDRQPSETQPYYALVLKGGVERSTPSRIMVSEVVPVTQRKERK
jgi:hypothetical protein